MKIPVLGVVWPERRHSTPNDRYRFTSMSKKQREEYLAGRAEMANGNGSRGVTIPTGLLVSILLALFGSGGTLAWRSAEAPVTVPDPQSVSAGHLQADHDELTKLGERVQALGEKVQSLKEALALISGRLERIDDRGEDTNNLLRRLVHDSNRAQSN